MMLLDIPTFTGHLHPLIVHLPIGFLLLAFLFDLLTYRKEYAAYKPAVSIILLAGFLAAVLACVFGYVLSLTGDYDADTLGNHKIAGIVLAVVAGLLYLLTTAKVKARLPLPARLFSVLVLGLVLLTSYAGHQGGSLTHGNNYLTLATLTEAKRPKPANADQAYIFEDVVHPILLQKCGQCHQAGKLKGRFSVQTLPTLLKGGKTGPAIVAGNLGESELCKRITLSPLDEKFMPADGKPPLTAAETAVIQWWIAKAGAVENKQLATLAGKDSIKPQVAAILGLGDGGEVGGASTTGLAQHINPDIPLTLDNTFITNLRAKGFMVRVMLQKPVMLDVTLPANTGKKMADLKDDLLRVAKNTVWLNLSGNNFNDGDMAVLQQMNNLEKLRLENNPVGDGVANSLVALKHLEAVNLNYTNITQAGLDALKKNTAIKRVYSWKGK